MGVNEGNWVLLKKFVAGTTSPASDMNLFAVSKVVANGGNGVVITFKASNKDMKAEDIKDRLHTINLDQIQAAWAVIPDAGKVDKTAALTIDAGSFSMESETVAPAATVGSASALRVSFGTLSLMGAVMLALLA